MMIFFSRMNVYGAYLCNSRSGFNFNSKSGDRYASKTENQTVSGNNGAFVTRSYCQYRHHNGLMLRTFGSRCHPAMASMSK
jgi:hypothetical protein